MSALVRRDIERTVVTRPEGADSTVEKTRATQVQSYNNPLTVSRFLAIAQAFIEAEMPPSTKVSVRVDGTAVHISAEYVADLDVATETSGARQ